MTSCFDYDQLSFSGSGSKIHLHESNDHPLINLHAPRVRKPGFICRTALRDVHVIYSSPSESKLRRQRTKYPHVALFIHHHRLPVFDNVSHQYLRSLHILSHYFQHGARDARNLIIRSNQDEGNELGLFAKQNHVCY
jgi:hypothetical protein